MDSVMDPELSAEMIKLLGQQLKVARRQLREAEQRSGTPASDAREEVLRAEVAALKFENSSLRANISCLQDQMTIVPIKTDDDHPDLIAQYEASMDAIQRELADAIKEKNLANLGKEKANEQLEELTNIREKYQNLKASKRECQEVIDELHSQLELFVKEFVPEGIPIKSNPPSFFRNTDYPTGDQPILSDIPVYSNALSMNIPKKVQSRCCCNGILLFEKDELIFSRRGIALCLFLRPMYQYNPTSNGTWDRFPADIEYGQKKDLCYYDGHGWKYLGTYERIGESFLLEDNKRVNALRIKAITKETVSSQDLVSPSQMRMVENMYWGGLLQIEVFGIQRISYNQEFAKSLKDLPRNGVKDTNPTSKKRKRVETGANHERKKKNPSQSGRKEG